MPNAGPVTAVVRHWKHGTCQRCWTSTTMGGPTSSVSYLRVCRTDHYLPPELDPLPATAVGRRGGAFPGIDCHRLAAAPPERHRGPRSQWLQQQQQWQQCLAQRLRTAPLLGAGCWHRRSWPLAGGLPPGGLRHHHRHPGHAAAHRAQCAAQRCGRACGARGRPPGPPAPTRQQAGGCLRPPADCRRRNHPRPRCFPWERTSWRRYPADKSVTRAATAAATTVAAAAAQTVGSGLPPATTVSPSEATEVGAPRRGHLGTL